MEQSVVQVLVIPDSLEDVSVIRQLVKSCEDSTSSFVVYETVTYEDSLKARVSNGFDVCFLDHNLTGYPIDGLDLLERAIAGGCTNPVILLTSMNDEDIEWAAFESGAAEFLNKNLDMNSRAIKQTIRYAIRSHKQIQGVELRLRTVQKQLTAIARTYRRG